MRSRETKTAIERAAEQLRAIVLDRKSGEFLGSEEAIIALLGCSRATVRQAARLLEREGLLRVRRGINGGYFGSRPDAGTIEATVASYLETLEMNNQDITIIASALWIEAVRKAAGAERQVIEDTLRRIRKQIKALKDTATFESVRDLELASQAKIFELANSNYIKLIFDINIAFSRRKFLVPAVDDDSQGHMEFVRNWRDGKLLELSAIAAGDEELAAMAAKYNRRNWHKRVYARFRSG